MRLKLVIAILFSAGMVFCTPPAHAGIKKILKKIGQAIGGGDNGGGNGDPPPSPPPKQTEYIPLCDKCNWRGQALSTFHAARGEATQHDKDNHKGVSVAKVEIRDP